MNFSIFLRFTCEFKLEMTPTNYLLVNYLRGRLMWKRLQPVWTGLEETSRISWACCCKGPVVVQVDLGVADLVAAEEQADLQGLLWCRFIWQSLRRCIRRTSRGVIVIFVIVIVILVSIGIHIVLRIFRVWCYGTFHFTIILQSSLTLVSCMYSTNIGIALFSYSYQIYHRLFKLKMS